MQSSIATSAGGRLMPLIGEWQGHEATAASAWGPGGASTGRSTFRSELDGLAIVQDYRQIRNGAVGYRVIGIFMASAQSDELLWWWFDSASGPPSQPAIGRWVDGALCFRGSSGNGGMHYRLRIGTDAYTFEMRDSAETAAEPFMTGHYERMR
jgi:hypothetical protein